MRLRSLFLLSAVLVLVACSDDSVSSSTLLSGSAYQVDSSTATRLLKLRIPVPSSWVGYFPVGTGEAFALDSAPPGETGTSWKEQITLYSTQKWGQSQEYWLGYWILHVFLRDRDNMVSPLGLDEDPEALYTLSTTASDGSYDRFTHYYTPAIWSYYESYFEGEEAEYRLGLYFRPLETDSLVVGSVVEGGPADQAGIQRGDVIATIDGVSAMTEVDSISSSKATTHALLVHRAGSDSFSVQVKTAVVNFPPVWWDTLQGGVGYVRIESFESGSAFYTDSLFSEAMAFLRENAPVGDWILDLRQDGGGTISSARGTASQLLATGDSIVHVTERDLDETTLAGKLLDSVYLAQGSYTWAPPTGTIRFLQDGGTASASEILLSSLRENLGSGIETYGETSYGKGIGQYYIGSPLGGCYAVTMMRIDPLHASRYHGAGIAPDVAVASDSALLRAWQDIVGASTVAARAARIGSGASARLASAARLDRLNREQFVRAVPPLVPGRFPIR